MRIFFILIGLSLAMTQSWYNHPELNWHTFETEHFIFHYHDETERSAREAATVAERIYGPVTNLYEFEPDSKTHIIIKDTDDYANGAAYYYDNKIEIWALPLDFDLRGAHRWIQNVITHEFTHIIQIGAAMKYPRRFPAAFIQFMGYEDEKRSDVLYGYPNTIMSYPIPGTAVPPWMAEGTAQFMYPGADYDYWDSHRDMILRDRSLHDKLLTFDEMNTFGKRGIGNESTYNQGFSFSTYLAELFGPEVLKDITVELSNPLSYSINTAFKNATGFSGYELFDDWSSVLESSYKLKTNHISQNEISGDILENEGTTNIHPVWAPDGNKFVFLSNKSNDYFGQTDLYLYSFEDSTSEKLKGGITTAPTWIDDSTLVYTRRSKPNMNGSKYFDLYKYDIQSEEEDRLTHGMRLTSPVYDKFSNRIAAITMKDGTSNIMISDVDDMNFTQITSLNNGIYMASLSWNGESLWVDVVENQGRSIFEVNLETGHKTAVIDNQWDERDPTHTDDGILYSSDRSGIFNLYYDNGESSGYITNVYGGAFMPSVSPKGHILYSLYENRGYKIALLKKIPASTKIVEVNNPSFSHTQIIENDSLSLLQTKSLELQKKSLQELQLVDELESKSVKKETELIKELLPTENIINIKKKLHYHIIPEEFVGYHSDNFKNRPLSDLITEPNTTISSNYKEDMTKLSFLPRVMIDYNTIKPGFYFMSNDYLDKFSMFGGVSTNNMEDLDLFLLIEYKKYWPTFYTNLFWITRHSTNFQYYHRITGDEVDNILIDSDLTFLLFAGEIGTRFSISEHKFWMDYNYSNYREHIFQHVIQYPADTEDNVIRYNYDLAFDYFRGHGVTLKYQYDARKPEFLKHMLPASGYTINAKIGYEWNNFMNGFGVNEEYSTFGANFAPHNTARMTIDGERHFKLSKKNHIVSTFSAKLGWISNADIDDFFYFFAGGLPGIKGYTFYESSLTGPYQIITTGILRYPIFMEQNYTFSQLSIQNMSLGLIGQWGGTFDKQFLEFMTEKEYKLSTGFEVRFSGYSFFAYPTALGYEYHQALFDTDETGKHYLTLLFNF